MSKKYLYYFSEGNDAFGGDKVTMKNILGGKGAGLAEMTAAGMPVPQGFTITTEACTQYLSLIHIYLAIAAQDQSTLLCENFLRGMNEFKLKDRCV